MKETDFVALYYCAARNNKEFALWVEAVRKKWARIQAKRRKS